MVRLGAGQAGWFLQWRMGTLLRAAGSQPPRAPEQGSSSVDPRACGVPVGDRTVAHPQKGGPREEGGLESGGGGWGPVHPPPRGWGMLPHCGAWRGAEGRAGRGGGTEVEVAWLPSSQQQAPGAGGGVVCRGSGEGEGFPLLKAEGISEDGLQHPPWGQGLVRPRDDDLF